MVENFLLWTTGYALSVSCACFPVELQVLLCAHIIAADRRVLSPAYALYVGKLKRCLLLSTNSGLKNLSVHSMGA